jgi:hypothetical protein
MPHVRYDCIIKAQDRRIRHQDDLLSMKDKVIQTLIDHIQELSKYVNVSLAGRGNNGEWIR